MARAGGAVTIPADFILFGARIPAHAFANTQLPGELERELVITVPLLEDKGLKGDGRPRSAIQAPSVNPR